MTKLQITLTDEETKLLTMRAAVLGYDVTKYAKFVLAQQAIEQTNYVPIFKASASMAKAIQEGRKEYKNGKLKSWPISI